MADSQFDAPAAAKTPPPVVAESKPYVEPDPNWLTSARSSRNLFLISIGLFAAALAFGFLTSGFRSREITQVVELLLGLGVAAGGFAGVRALASLVLMAVAPGKVGWKEPMKMLGIAGFAGFGVFLAYLSTLGFSRGRQLRKRGKVLLPPVDESGAAWADLPTRSSVPAGVRDAVAERWRENGRTEHASVAAFARLTTDLMVLGAPPKLIHDANRDAKDEIRHAELCFSLAKALDGRDAGPAAFPDAQDARPLPSNRTLALAQLAVDSLIDGALHEGLSARVIAFLSKRTEEPAIKALLSELAVDEARHSAHGWDVVEWCLKEGGAPVAYALRGALAGLPDKPSSDIPADARDGGWEPYGLHGEALEADQHRRSRAVLTARVCAMTAALA